MPHPLTTGTGNWPPRIASFFFTELADSVKLLPLLLPLKRVRRPVGKPAACWNKVVGERADAGSASARWTSVAVFAVVAVVALRPVVTYG